MECKLALTISFCISSAGSSGTKWNVNIEAVTDIIDEEESSSGTKWNVNVNLVHLYHLSLRVLQELSGM